MRDLKEGDYVVFVWDLYEKDKNRRSLFYKKLSGYKTRRYGEVIDENEALLKRLRDYDLEKPEEIPPEALPEGVDGISESGRVYVEYEYDGILKRIPPDEKVRLNDSAYMVRSGSAHLIRDLLEEFEDIVKSLYELRLDWEQVEGIKAEGEVSLKFSTGAEQTQEQVS